MGRFSELENGALLAERIAVRHMEGTVRGFLVLRNMEGRTLAAGNLSQVVQGDRLVARLTFRFKHGSVDDETTVFSQRRSRKKSWKNAGGESHTEWHRVVLDFVRPLIKCDVSRNLVERRSPPYTGSGCLGRHPDTLPSIFSFRSS